MNIQNKLCALIVFLAPLAALGQMGHFQVEGKLPEKYNGKKLFLNYAVDNKLMKDSALVQRGNFQFKGDLSSPSIAEIRSGDMQQLEWVSLLLKNGKIKLSSTDSLHNAKIRGDADVVAYHKLATQIKENSYQLTKAFFKGFAIKDESERNQYFKIVDDQVAKATNLNNELIFQFMTDNPKSIVSLLSFRNHPLNNNSIKNDKKIAYFEILSPSLRQTVIGKEIATALQQAQGLSVLTNYIDFTSTNPEGKQLRMQDILAKHEYVLLDFWASWCGPCRKENPNVVKAFNAYKDKGFSVLSVSLDKDKAKWLEAIEADSMPWYHVSSLMYWDEPVAKLYNVRS